MEELSRGKNWDLKQFSELFHCFCYANLPKLLQTLQNNDEVVVELLGG